MKAKDAMIVWVPNTDLYKTNPKQGDIQVTTIPESPELKQYTHSVGACDANWSATDNQGRKDLAQRYFSQITHRYGLDADSVERALRQVDEFADTIFDRNKPTGTDWI